VFFAYFVSGLYGLYGMFQAIHRSHILLISLVFFKDTAETQIPACVGWTLEVELQVHALAFLAIIDFIWRKLTNIKAQFSDYSGRLGSVGVVNIHTGSCNCIVHCIFLFSQAFRLPRRTMDLDLQPLKPGKKSFFGLPVQLY